MHVYVTKHKEKSQNEFYSVEKDGDDDVDHGSTMKKTDDSTMKSSSGTLYTRASKCTV